MLRRAFRKVLQQPFFTLLTVATLGIGIGAVATCFSSVNTLLFRPLPASPMSDRLVWLSQTSASPFDADVQRNLGFNYVDQHEVAQRAQTLSDIWVFTSLTVIVDDEQGPGACSAPAFRCTVLTPSACIPSSAATCARAIWRPMRHRWR